MIYGVYIHEIQVQVQGGQGPRGAKIETRVEMYYYSAYVVWRWRANWKGQGWIGGILNEIKQLVACIENSAIVGCVQRVSGGEVPVKEAVRRVAEEKVDSFREMYR